MSMTYLLIILVVFIALSPLITMMPSRRQRQIADLRQAAAVSGLYVELKHPPRGAEGPLQAFYGCRRGHGQAKPAVAVLYTCEEGDWAVREGIGSAAKLALLAAFPETVVVVSEDRHGAGVYWEERGEKSDVQRIAETLKALLAIG